MGEQQSPAPSRSGCFRRWVLSNADQTYLEALALLLVARVLTAFLSRRTARWAFAQRAADDPRPARELEQRVQWALESAQKWLPWEDACLPRAIAGKMLLARHGIRSTIHLGVAKGKGGPLYAHAWLEAGGPVLTGEQQMLGVTKVL